MTTLAEYLEAHAEIVPYMQTRHLLLAAAQELRKGQDVPTSNFYLKCLPNGEFEVCYED